MGRFPRGRAARAQWAGRFPAPGALAALAALAAFPAGAAASIPGPGGVPQPPRPEAELAAGEDPREDPVVRLGDEDAAKALLARVIENREHVRVRERDLVFQQLITSEALDEEGEITGTANALYEYTPVAGRHLWRLLERDGVPINGFRRWREERRYRNAVEDAHEEAANDREAVERGDTDYEVKPKNGMDLFYEIVRDAIDLDMFEGDLVAGEPLDGRPIRIVRFWPRPGFGKAPSRTLSVVSRCAGELWVDPEALQVARVRARLLSEESFVAGLFGRLYRGTTADVESGFDGEIWLPHRVTMTVNARMYFFRRIRRRVHYDFLGFQTLTASREATPE